MSGGKLFGFGLSNSMAYGSPPSDSTNSRIVLNDSSICSSDTTLSSMINLILTYFRGSYEEVAEILVLAF